MSSDDGREPLRTTCYVLAATSDYLDGIAARVTGQYSRLGALMDPLIDRLVVISGVVVVWNFELLPRWALAVLVAREVYMLVAVAGGAARSARPAHQLDRADRGVADDGCGGRRALRLGGLRRGAPVPWGSPGSIAASVQYTRDGLRALRARGSRSAAS